MVRIGLTLALVGALACGGDNVKETCQHMLKLAEKEGKAADDDGMSKCVEMFKEAKKALGDEKFAKFASCVKGKDTIESALMDCDPEKGEVAPGESSSGQAYVNKAKSSEALTFVKKMYDGARMYYMDEHAAVDSMMVAAPQFPGKSVGPTPPLGECCKQPDGKCKPDVALWEDPVWVGLMFSVDDPHYYSYEYKTDDPTASFTVSAYGDLDCDGVYSTFRMTGKAGPDGPVGAVEMEKENEME